MAKEYVLDVRNGELHTKSCAEGKEKVGGKPVPAEFRKLFPSLELAYKDKGYKSTHPHCVGL